METKVRVKQDGLVRRDRTVRLR